MASCGEHRPCMDSVLRWLGWMREGVGVLVRVNVVRGRCAIGQPAVRP